MKFLYKDFKVVNNNGKGFWVSLRELNYMLSNGIIQVEDNKLEEYKSTVIPELSIIRMYEDYDMTEEMQHDVSEEDRREAQLFYEAGKSLRNQLD